MQNMGLRSPRQEDDIHCNAIVIAGGRSDRKAASGEGAGKKG